MAFPQKAEDRSKRLEKQCVGKIPEQCEQRFRDGEHRFRKIRKSVHIETGIGVHVRPEQVFTLNQNACSRWAGICKQRSCDEERCHAEAAALAQKGRWVTVYYGWRPNLPDEADNHLIELALAGGTSAIVTHNVRDMVRGELRLGRLRILTPAQCLEELE
jgi:hypothetical protein